MRNKFGLLDTDLEAVVSILSRHPKVDKAIIFGSRAKGNFKNGSTDEPALIVHIDRVGIEFYRK